MGIIKNFIERLKERERENQRKMIQASVEIKLKDETLWIMVNGCAVYKADKNESVEKVIQRINEFKQTAIEYKEYGNC